jgi:nucleotide-binding universal stress UspA family protein
MTDHAAPQPGDGRPTRRVLIALDDSDESRGAAEFAHDFFQGLPVEILAISVADPLRPWLDPAIGFGTVYPFVWPANPTAHAPARADEVISDERRNAEDALQHVLDESGLDGVERIVSAGDAAAAIAAAATDHDVDLIVVGASQKGFVAQLLDPSVPRELSEHGDRPVLVVRSPG